jgi:hypothetical protein
VDLAPSAPFGVTHTLAQSDVFSSLAVGNGAP